MEHELALVDDHHMVRTALAGMINSLGGYRVTIEAGHGRELIEALEQVKDPAIAVVDLNMPVMDGYETISWLKEQRPGILSLALTFDAAEDALVRAVRAGARGFVLKNARPHVLKYALDALLEQGYYYTDEDHRTLMQNPDLRTGHERELERIKANITPREMEFLRHLCSPEEPTYGQIAERMGVVHRSVDHYRIGLCDKFRLKGKTGLVLFALRWRLVAGPDP